MSFIKLNKSLFETSSIILRKNVTYTSSSIDGVSNALKLSKRELGFKEVTQDSAVANYSDSSITNVTNRTNDNAYTGYLLLPNSEVPGNPNPFDGKGVTPTNIQPQLFQDYTDLLNVAPENTMRSYVTGVFYDYDSRFKSLSILGGLRSFPQFIATYVEGTTISKSTGLAKQINSVNNTDALYAGNKSVHDYVFDQTPDIDPFSIFELDADINDGNLDLNGSKALFKKADFKKTVIDHLIPHYKTNYNNCDFSYTNYNCLNFFYDSNSDHTGREVLVYNSGYPSYLANYNTNGTLNSNVAEFFVSCWVNPKYKNSEANGDMNTGTILHISSSLALSIVTGSHRDEEGYADRYRLMVQLKHSAGINPSTFLVTGSSNRIDDGRYPHDLIYLTDDNSIKRNTWNYVSAKWGYTKNSQQLTLRINDKKYTYTVPSASISENNAFGNEVTSGVPYAFVGNYHDGEASTIKNYFDTNKSKIDFARSIGGATAHAVPTFVNTQHVNHLQAELHELRVHGSYLSDTTEEKYRYTSFDNANFNHRVHNLNLYIPGWYDSNIHNSQLEDSTTGLILFNPALYGGNYSKSDGYEYLYNGVTNPFMSHGIGGKYVNLHNFTSNFSRSRLFERPANNNYGYTRPIHFNMSASLIAHVTDTSAALISVRDTLANQDSIIKRNALITPCDNGYFTPNYYETDKTGYRNKNDLGNESYETISLRNILTGALGYLDSTDDGRSFPIYYVTKDDTSNDISMFIISNIYYGERIHPGSFVIKDDSLFGTNDKISYTIKDDGKGSLYRADSDGDHAEWASVGNIFYDEGVVLIKSPHMPYFGKNKYQIDFKGEHTNHVTTIHVPCPQQLFMSSSNPTYEYITGSAEEADKNNPFVYITGVNIHDNNLNVIMKAKMAQPIKKRKSDSYMFRLKQDY